MGAHSASPDHLSGYGREKERVREGERNETGDRDGQGGRVDGWEGGRRKEREGIGSWDRGRENLLHRAEGIDAPG